MSISISGPVGLNAMNRSDDVIKVQVMLNHYIGNKKLLGYKPLTIDGKCGSKTREAILALQIQNGLLSEEHFKCQVYPHGKTIAFMNANAGYIPTWEVADHPTTPTLLDLLREVKTDELGLTDLQRKHLGRLRRFFIRGLEGEAIDDTYWNFTYYDALGTQHACSEKHSVDSVERSKLKQNALRVLQKLTKTATSKDEVGAALRRVEETVACNTFVLIRWYVQNDRLGDAPIEEFTEMTYLREIALLAAQNVPESIYAVYGDEIVLKYPVARPMFTPDILWQMRRSGRGQ
jgi:hypothetical protein